MTSSAWICTCSPPLALLSSPIDVISLPKRLFSHIAARSSLVWDQERAYRPMAQPSPRSVLACSPFDDILNRRISPGKQAVVALIAANLGVFGLWRIVPEATMMSHWTTSMAHMRKGLYHTLLTATFSHTSFLHLAVNMYALWSFSPAIEHTLSTPQFLSVYLASGLAGTVASNVFHAARRINIPSLGASGCIFGIITLLLAQHPNLNVDFFFFIRMTADQALLASVVGNLALMVGAARFRVDGAGHLGGMAVGYGTHLFLTRGPSQRTKQY